jgi:hypothetical protein
MAAATTTVRKKAPAKKTTAAKGRPTPARPKPSEMVLPDPGVVVEPGGVIPGQVVTDFAEKVTDEDIDALQRALESDDGPIGPGGEIRPVEIGKAGQKGPDLVHIFSINGTQHFIPKNPTIAVLIQFLRDARVIGRDQAVENLLTSVLGDRNLAALASNNQVSEEDVAKVFVIVSHIAFGALAKFRQAADPS